jgi:hypothetical protein
MDVFPILPTTVLSKNLKHELNVKLACRRDLLFLENPSRAADKNLRSFILLLFNVALSSYKPMT